MVHKGGLDSVAVANDRLISYMKHEFANDTATLRGNFKGAKQKGLHYYTSADGNIRFYYWDTRLGNTVRFYGDFAQYRTAYGVAFTDMLDPNVQGDPGVYYSSLITDTIKDAPVYLITQGYIRSEKEKGEAVIAYSIINDQLLKVLVFEKDHKKLSHLENDYNAYSYTGPKSKKPTIHFSADRLKLYVPVVTEDGEYTNEVSVYEFDGEIYRLTGNE
jgi:hypothetical protein